MAGIFDGSQMRVYIDGTLRGSKSSTFAPGTGTNSLKIGARGDDGSNTFNGKIDEVRITAGVVYTSDFTPQRNLATLTGTRGLWVFDGQTTGDSSGNNNNGSLVSSAAYSTDVPNLPPSVTLTGPANNTTFSAPVDITLTASASDSDGTISKVEFFQGNTKLGEDSSSPYSIIWSNVPAGTYSLTAQATDNYGRATTSTAVSVTVIAATTSLYGKVTRLDGTTPIPGTTIRVSQGAVTSGTAITNSTGDYTVLNLATGSYTVEASAAGYETAKQAGVSITSGTATTLNFSLAIPITYAYDDLGRLTLVMDKDGSVAKYSYDAVGNLLSISRQSSTQASVLQFTPSNGVVGIPVTIYGTGFSITPSQNAVTFNGTSATVISSTSTQIVTSVPASASTGPIAVTSPAGSATSSSSFTVTSSGSGGAPSITGFTPTVGITGTAITVNGTNFDTVPTNNITRINVTPSVVTSATSSSLVTTVPNATSGHISLMTAAGAAVSSGDFFIPPAPYTAADVLVTDRITYGQTKTAALSSGNKIGLYLFEGIAGSRVCLNITGRTINHSQVTIYNPDGTVLASNSFYSWQGDLFYEPQTLPISGTYTIMATSLDNTTGNISLTPYESPADLTGTISIGGSPVTVSLSPGQNDMLTFSGTAGQKISLVSTNSTIAACDVFIKKPDGNSFGGLTAGTGSGFMDGQVLPATGQYTMQVSPQGAYSGSITLTLNNAADVMGTITPGGSSVTVTTTVPGQNGVFTFEDTAGQRVSLSITGKTFQECTVSLKKPDGNSVYSQYMSPSWGGAFMDSTSLPLSGTYTILVDPGYNFTGSITLALYDTTTDVTGTLTIGGPSLTVSLPTPGQNGILTFSGTAGQRVGINTTAVTLSSTTLTVKKPDGTNLLSGGVSTSGGLIETNPLPVTGTYTIVLDPYDTATGSMTLALTDISDLTGTLSIGGPSVSFTIGIPGQNARFTFSGTAGQRISFNVTGVTITTSDIYVYNPDGTVLINLAGAVNRVGTGGAFVDATVLPATGTYSITVDPYTTFTGNMTLALYDVADLTGTITPGGAPLTVSTLYPGQVARISFTGTTGQKISLNITDVTAVTTYTYVTILKPDNTSLASIGISGSGTGSRGFIDATSLPVDGVYTILIDPPGAATTTMTLNLYDVTQDVTGTVTIGGSAVNVTISIPCQNGQLTFSGTAGQAVTVRITSNTMNVNIKLLKPDGTILTSTGSSNSVITLATQTLPTTGTYTIVIDPVQISTGSMSVSVTSP